MGKAKLDVELLRKLADRTGKSAQYLREQISRKAGSLGITSPAYLIRWAQQEGIGVARYLSKLPPEVRQEVRSAGATEYTPPQHQRTIVRNRRRSRKGEPITAATIDAILQDQQLRGRCRDLLQATKHFDRVVREATTVLDHRLKTKCGITNMNPAKLVNEVLNPDPQKAVIVVSSNQGEQEGFHAICRGVMLAFRNKTHHELSDKFTREDALKFCGFIDSLLAVIEQAELHTERL